jgi:hypothetical protein
VTRGSVSYIQVRGIQQVAGWWQEAEAAARSKRVPRARRFLRWILACCPDEEEAWLLLAQLASSQEARVIYLRQAYLFHPGSARVQAALRQARCRQLESAVGDLKSGLAMLRCLPDERHICHPGVPRQAEAHRRTLIPWKRRNGNGSGPATNLLLSQG